MFDTIEKPLNLFRSELSNWQLKSLSVVTYLKNRINFIVFFRQNLFFACFWMKKNVYINDNCHVWRKWLHWILVPDDEVWSRACFGRLEPLRDYVKLMFTFWFSTFFHVQRACLINSLSLCFYYCRSVEQKGHGLRERNKSQARMSSWSKVGKLISHFGFFSSKCSLAWLCHLLGRLCNQLQFSRCAVSDRPIVRAKAKWIKLRVLWI